MAGGKAGSATPVSYFNAATYLLSVTLTTPGLWGVQYKESKECIGIKKYTYINGGGDTSYACTIFKGQQGKTAILGGGGPMNTTNSPLLIDILQFIF